MSGRDQQIAPAVDPTPRPLVGRQPLLKALASTLKRSARKAFHLVELVGEPGVGKSRLVSEVAARARELGMVTLAGRAAEFELDAPFAAVVDALDDHLETQIGLLTRRLPMAEARLLTSVFPGLTIETPQVPIPSGAGGARYRLHRAVRTLLEVLAESSGLTLLLDDVHWADEATIELLDYLVRHPPRGQVVIAVAYRPAQVSPRLRTALSQVPGDAGTRLTVTPLTLKETEEFLGNGMSPAKRRRLFESSGGNPFYLEALARAEKNTNPLAQVTGDAAEDALRDVPDVVRAALTVELNQLSPKALLLAHAAAVVGDEFEPASAAAAAELTEGEALQVVDELIGRDVVRVADIPGRFRFRHPLVRHIAYTTASAGWRMATHGRVVAHLQGLGAPAPQLARHVMRSAGFGDVEAVEVLAEAARSVAPRAPATASAWLVKALQLLPDVPAHQQLRIRLLMELVGAQSVCGQFTEARDNALEALDRLPADAYATRAQVASIYSRVERLLGRRVEARALLLRELNAIPEDQSAHAGPLHVRLGVEAIWMSDLVEADRLLTAVPPEQLPTQVALAVAAVRTMPPYAAGNSTLAMERLAEAAQLTEAATSADIAPWLDAYTWMCFTELLTCQFHSAVNRYERILEIARSTGQIYIMPPLLAGQARALALLGRLDEAFEAYEELNEVSRLGDSQQSITMALAIQSILLTWAGDHTEALKVSTEAVSGDLTLREWAVLQARVAHTMALAHSGDLDGADEFGRKVFADFTHAQQDQNLLLFCCETLAHQFAVAGRYAEATAWAEQAEQKVDPALAVNVAITELVRAHALTGENPAAAAELALKVAATLEARGLRLDAGRAHLRAGLAYAAAGQRDKALPQLATAAETFAACKAKTLRAEALQATRRLGVRVAVPGGRSQGGPFGLSPRELEIARLVLDGHTNQQIAEKLFIGIRTVETHVSHVFTKLGVTSRASVGRVLGPALDAHDKG
ncbi:ATP/maltotriose-dependent transcriptional regulator MalT [Crossiella equi]|uniref:ATP/maltotriose-dependent transcriptional regulator MalT n=1 Tax=Crossiella equi TaxID=130796 RepID=A0ABS5AAK9_9PSEU|nr:AAA family ATPase [Crossiella equi]MBP2473617.1 ATP/maltotriose-dependent transcriptional regulator MalT [Crossiella equi]